MAKNSKSTTYSIADKLSNNFISPTSPASEQQAFAQFADFREDETPAMLSNVNTLDDIEEQEESKPWLRKLLLAVPMLFAMFCFWQALPSRVTTPQSVQAVNQTTTSQPERQLKTTPIKEIRLGQRTIGRNPDREDTHPNQPEPVPASWREIHLELAKPDGSLVHVELLRPLAWLNYHEATLNGVIYLDLPEMGAQGFATVTEILPCPEIEVDTDKHRNVITGRFIHHSSGNLINLLVEGETEPTGVTDNHPYWSVDRQKFIEVGHLQNGEHVQTVNGLAKVASITPHHSNETVYNLEIQGEHVYRVGSLGTLVHNDCLDYAKSVLRNRPNGTIIRMDPLSKRAYQTGTLPGYPVSGRHGMRDGWGNLLSSGDRHYFHLEKGILRDPAHPRGIPINDWFDEYSNLNNMLPGQVIDFFNFLPYLP